MEKKSREIFQGPKTFWEVRMEVETRIDGWLQDYFEDINISQEEQGRWVLKGDFPDISGVFGFILKMRDLALDFLLLRVEKREVLVQKREKEKKRDTGVSKKNGEKERECY